MQPTAYFENISTSLNSLEGLLSSLKNVMPSIGNSARHLQDAISALEGVTSQLACSSEKKSIASQLLLDFSFQRLNASITKLEKAISANASNISGLPQSFKTLGEVAKDIENLRCRLMNLKVDLPFSQGDIARQLSQMAADLSHGKIDADYLENVLDDAIRNLLIKLYGTTELSDEGLRDQQADLEASIEHIQAVKDEEARVLGLALNSLQRLHARQIEVLHCEEDEPDYADEDDDDDSDDPFYMPFAAAAIRMADEGKFALLAEPLNLADAESIGLNILIDEPSNDTEADDSSLELAPSGAEDVIQANDIADDINTEIAALIASGTEPPEEEAPETPKEREVKIPVYTRNVSLPRSKAISPTSASNEEKLSAFLSGKASGERTFKAQMDLSEEGCVKLATFLATSTNVLSLSLSHNSLSDKHLKIISDGLKANKTVTSVNLPDNDISDSGVRFLVDALVGNKSLTQLQLSQNKIGDNGAMALAELIGKSTSLKKVGLSHNAIGKPGCRALMTAIQNNRSLNQLQLLPGNPVEEKDAEGLAKALKRNKKFSVKAFLGL